MTYYLQVNQENIITDAINYQVEGYIAYETEYPLPTGINGGWFTWDGTTCTEDLGLKPISPETEIDKLKTRTSATEDALIMLMDLGIM